MEQCYKRKVLIVIFPLLKEKRFTRAHDINTDPNINTASDEGDDDQVFGSAEYDRKDCLTARNDLPNACKPRKYTTKARRYI